MKKAEAKDCIEKSGVRSTDARESLLAMLSVAHKPLSAKTLSVKLAPAGVDRVTVYRTLELFIEKGIIRRVDTGDRDARYELVDAKHDHHHLICLGCKKVADFTGCSADGLIARALKQAPEFVSVSHHSFDLFGFCTACAPKR